MLPEPPYIIPMKQRKCSTDFTACPAAGGGVWVYVRRDVSRLLYVNSHGQLVRVQGSHCDISPCLCSPKLAALEPVFVSRSDAVSHSRSLCLSASFYVFVCVRAEGKTDRKTFQNKSRIKEEERKRGRARGRMNEEKAYYQKTDGPPIHSGPTGTTLCTSGLPALQRGVGHLNTTLCVCTFVC